MIPANEIICGDCIDIMKGLPDNCVDLVLTDPPYGVSVKNIKYVSPCGTRNYDFFPEDTDWDATQVLCTNASSECCRINPLSQVWWCGHRQIGPLVSNLEANGYSTRLLSWVKKHTAPMPPGAGFVTAFELAVYAYRKGRVFNGDQFEKNLFVTDSYRYNQPGKVNHPTQKPLKLMLWIIRLLTNPNDIILDPFCGSGSTCVAAKMLGRRYIGIDIREKYCKLTRTRLKEFDTGVPVKEQLAGQKSLFE